MRLDDRDGTGGRSSVLVAGAAQRHARSERYESTTQLQTNPAPGFDERNPRYQLCPGDVLDLRFEFTPEFNQSKIAVQPDGFATLSGVGDVHVAGLTVPELTKTLESTYSKILAKPVITVMLRDFNKPYFIATGQVGKPGKYDLRANTTLIEAIGIAGGLNDTSKHSSVWVFHRLPDGTVQRKRVNVKQMLAAGNLREDVHLQPGDTIFIPQNTASKIKAFISPSSERPLFLASRSANQGVANARQGLNTYCNCRAAGCEVHPRILLAIAVPSPPVDDDHVLSRCFCRSRPQCSCCRATTFQKPRYWCRGSASIP